MITRRRLFIGAAGLLSAPGCSRAQLEPLTTQALEQELRKSGAPALAAAAVAKAQTAKTWVAGERRVGSGVAATSADLWHLGSITKSMTATLVARLVEAGAVRWDDTPGELLRDAAPHMHDAYRSVSFRHLLSHRAGLPRDIPRELFARYSRDGGNVRDERRSYAREALRMPPIGAKETSFSYSNNGYVVAGAMLEAKLETTWEELLRRRVFEPLRLTSAGFGPPGVPGGLTQPVGHGFRDGRLTGIHVDNPVALGPGGRVHMSLDDVLSYLAAHRDAVPFLAADTWRTLHTPPFGGDYAMGWGKRRDGVLSHTGSNTLWYAAALFDQSRGVAAVAVANEGRPEAAASVERALARAVAAVT